MLFFKWGGHMDKRKAAERSRVLRNFIELLSNKRLPQLEKMLEDGIKYQQVKQFKDWCSELPDSLIQLFNQKHSVLLQESEKEKFYPALFFGNNTDLFDILYNLYINREKCRNTAY